MLCALLVHLLLCLYCIVHSFIQLPFHDGLDLTGVIAGVQSLERLANAFDVFGDAHEHIRCLCIAAMVEERLLIQGLAIPLAPLPIGHPGVDHLARVAQADAHDVGALDDLGLHPQQALELQDHVQLALVCRGHHRGTNGLLNESLFFYGMHCPNPKPALYLPFFSTLSSPLRAVPISTHLRSFLRHLQNSCLFSELIPQFVTFLSSEILSLISHMPVVLGMTLSILFHTSHAFLKQRFLTT